MPPHDLDSLLRKIARMDVDIARLKTVESGGGGAGGGVVAVVDLAGQTDDIATANFENTSTVGMYRVNVYMETTTADAGAGIADLSFSWTDEAASQTYTPATFTLDLTTLGAVSSLVPRTIYVASGSISYEVTHTGSYGSAVYSLHMRVERLPAQAVEDSAPVIVYTTDDTPTTIASITPAAHTVTLLAGYIVAHRTGGENGAEDDAGIWEVACLVKYDGSNITIMAMFGTDGIVGGGGSYPAYWSVDWNETPAGTMCLQVTGYADENITWEWIQSRLLPEAIGA
jgi:hypothetical protein